MFPARFELATFRVLGGRDNHYTTETTVYNKGRVRGIIGMSSLGHTQIHTLTVVQGRLGGGGVNGTPPRSFWNVAVIWNDFTFSWKPLIFLTNEVYFRGGGAAEGLWRHQ